MPWFRNHYVCHVCEGHWHAEHAEMQDANCPHCRTFGVTAYRSEDWSRVIDRAGDRFVVLECVKVDARGPDWRALQAFDSRDEAKAFLASR